MRSLLALILLMTCLAKANPSTEIILQVGQEKILSAHGSLRAESNANFKLVPMGDSVKIVGLKPGWSSFVIGTQGHEAHILSKQQMKTWQLLQKYVQLKLGLQVAVSKGQVILKGRLLRSSDWLDLVKKCPGCAYHSELEMSESVADQARGDLQKLTSERGLPDPALRWGPQATWLVRTQSPPSGLFSLAQSLGIEIQNEEAVVDLAPLVRTQIFVLEAKREHTRQWGIQWPSAVTAQILPKVADPLSNIALSAIAMENQGEAKILASPTLLCRSGQEAEFLAGGEFPVKIMNLHRQDVLWKKYGIVLRVKPTADRFGHMNLSLETEISSIDPSRTVDGVPGLFTNRVMSHFDLAEPKTIAISGLIKSEDSQSLQGLPGLSRIPVLGALFGSRDFRENRSELLILVRPSIVDQAAIEKEPL